MTRLKFRTQSGMAQSVSGTESSSRLPLSSLATIREALYDVRSKWEDIGIELLDKNETDAIKKEKQNALRDCLTEMLSIYLKRSNPEPSWNSIIAALRAKAVGESQLAQDLEEKYLSQTVMSRQQKLLKPQVDCQSRKATSLENQGETVGPYLDTDELSPHKRKDLDMSTTLSDVAAAERKKADTLGLTHSEVTLHEVTPGRLAVQTMSLSIPIPIADKIIPLQASQLSKLKANRFTVVSEKTTMDQPRML